MKKHIIIDIIIIHITALPSSHCIYHNQLLYLTNHCA